jgi:hypothetical protein
MDSKIKFQSIEGNIIKIKKRRIIKDDNIGYSSSLYKSCSAYFGLGGYGIELI